MWVNQMWPTCGMLTLVLSKFGHAGPSDSDVGLILQTPNQNRFDFDLIDVMASVGKTYMGGTTNHKR